MSNYSLICRKCQSSNIRIIKQEMKRNLLTKKRNHLTIIPDTATTLTHIACNVCGEILELH